MCHFLLSLQYNINQSNYAVKLQKAYKLAFALITLWHIPTRSSKNTTIWQRKWPYTLHRPGVITSNTGGREMHTFFTKLLNPGKINFATSRFMLPAREVARSATCYHPFWNITYTKGLGCFHCAETRWDNSPNLLHYTCASSLPMYHHFPLSHNPCTLPLQKN